MINIHFHHTRTIARRLTTLAQERGLAISIHAVDTGGRTILAMRCGGSSYAALTLAEARATGALAMRRSTASPVQTDESAQMVASLVGGTVSSGASIIIYNDRCIGAIGMTCGLGNDDGVLSAQLLVDVAP
jgi:uncharacterized protein GlcG (DUF336 family)